MAFGDSGVLDQFTRGDATSDSNANWTTGLYSGTSAFGISSNQAYGPSGDYRERYWNQSTPGPDSEVFVTLPTRPANGEIIYLWLRAQTPGTSGADAYELILNGNAGGTNHTWELNRVVNESATQLATRTQTFANGDALGIRATGNGATITITIWHRPSGGSWTQLGASASDTNANRITAAGRIGLGFNGATTRADDFGGGNINDGVTLTFTGTQTNAQPGSHAVTAGTPATLSFVGADNRGDPGIASVSAQPTTLSFVGTPAEPQSGAGSHAVTAGTPATLAFAGTPSPAEAGGNSQALTTISSNGRDRRPAAFGYSLQFFGTTAYNTNKFRIPRDGEPTDVGAGDFTIDVWVRGRYADNTTQVTDVRNSNVVLDGDIYGHPRGMVLGLTRNGSGALVPIFGVAGASLDWVSILGTTNIGDGRWHLLSVDRNASTGLIRLLVDCAAEASATYTTGDLSYPDGYDPGQGEHNPDWIGGGEKHGLGSAFIGQMDELRFSDVRRHAIAQPLPIAPFAPDANTVGLYHFDDGYGTTLADSATVTGAPTNGVLLIGGTPRGPIWAPFDLLNSPETPGVATVASAPATLAFIGADADPRAGNAAVSAASPVVLSFAGAPADTQSGAGNHAVMAGTPATLAFAGTPSPAEAGNATTSAGSPVALAFIGVPSEAQSGTHAVNTITGTVLAFAGVDAGGLAGVAAVATGTPSTLVFVGTPSEMAPGVATVSTILGTVLFFVGVDNRGVPGNSALSAGSPAALVFVGVDTDPRAGNAGVSAASAITLAFAGTDAAPVAGVAIVTAVGTVLAFVGVNNGEQAGAGNAVISAGSPAALAFAGSEALVTPGVHAVSAGAPVILVFAGTMVDAAAGVATVGLIIVATATLRASRRTTTLRASKRRGT